MTMAERDLPAVTYLRLRALDASSPAPRRRRRAPGEGEEAFAPGRDPVRAGAVLSEWTHQVGWAAPLAVEDLMTGWREIAGEQTAEHTRPRGVERGVLVIQCDSTAWAAQLRLMRTHVVTRVMERFPDAGVSDIRFVGPDVPSWKHGPRTVPGRGPRDTYG